MKTKRLVLMLLVMFMSVTMWAEDGIVGDMKWEYDGYTRTLTFSSVDPDSEPVAMPEYEYEHNIPWANKAEYALYVKFINISHIGRYALFGAQQLISVDIPNTVTSIGECAFTFCSSLKSVTLPNSITSIGMYAFSHCTNLTSINIPDRLTELKGTFDNCSSLESITIPASVTSFGNYTFQNCTGLKSIAVEAETPPTTGFWCFEGVDKTIPVYVPNSAMDAYKSADGWKDFTNFQELYITGTQGDLKWDFNKESKRLIFSSVDPDSEPVEMPDCEKDETPWIEFTTQALSVKFVNISHIGDYALCSLTSLITSVDIPNTVTSIGNSAFEYCRSLESLTLPNSVTSIGQRAFASCSKLTSMRIPNGVTRLPDETFAHCASLKSVTIPASVTELGRYVLSSCKALTSIFVEAETPPAVEAYCFLTVDKSIPVYVPCGKGDAYRSANGWKDFTNIIDHRYKHSGDPNSEEYYTCTVCGEIDPAYYHVHNYSDEWSFDGTHHWHACTSEVGVCTAPRKDESEHFPLNILNDEANYQCDICGYVDEAKKMQYESRDYLSMTAVGGDVTIGMSKVNSPSNYTIQVSEDGNHWSEPMELSATVSEVTTIPEGQTRYFRYGNTYAITSLNSSRRQVWRFTIDGEGSIEAGGNIMSLLDQTCQATTTGANAFSTLFYNCTKLTKAPKLPATTLGESCYYNMFGGCSSLQEVELPMIVDCSATDCLSNWLSGTADDGKLILPLALIGNSTVSGSIPSNWSLATRIKLNEDPTPGEEGNFYTTFYDGRYDYKVEDGFKAYSGSVIDEELRLTATPDNIIPKGDGVLVHGGSGEVLLTVSNGSAERIDCNVLTGSDNNTTAPANCYILSYGQNGLGFYKYAAGKTLSAHKAYLVYEKPTGAKGLRMVFADEEVDGIENIKDNDSLRYDNIYSLSGVRLDKLQKGINIVNGKKIVVK